MKVTKISIIASKKLSVNYNSTSISVGLSAELSQSDNIIECYKDLDRQAKAMVESSLGIAPKRTMLKVISS
jgi:hypothetical protein